MASFTNLNSPLNLCFRKIPVILFFCLKILENAVETIWEIKYVLLDHGNHLMMEVDLLVSKSEIIMNFLIKI
jgi:hypothetical protein